MAPPPRHPLFRLKSAWQIDFCNEIWDQTVGLRVDEGKTELARARTQNGLERSPRPARVDAQAHERLVGQKPIKEKQNLPTKSRRRGCEPAD